MSVVDSDDRILLTCGHNFVGQKMSALASVVKSDGESLKAAVAREMHGGGRCVRDLYTMPQ